MTNDEINNALKTIVKGAGIIFVGFLSEYVISFAGKIVMARLLETTSFGWMALGSMILSFATMFSLLGLNSGVARYLPMAKNDKERKGIILSVLYISIPVSVIVSIFIFILADEIAVRIFHDSGLVGIIKIFAIIVPFSAFINITISIFIGLKNAKLRLYVQNVIIPSARFVSVTALILFGFGAIGAACGYLVSYFIASLFSVYYLIKNSPVATSVEPKYFYTELVSFSLPLMVSTSAIYVMTNTDTFMLGYFLSSAEVGIYNASYSLSTLTHVFSMSIGLIFMPVFSEMLVKNKDESRKIYQITTKWIFMLSLPVFFVLFLFPEQVIKFTFGQKYSTGAVSLMILTLCFFVGPILGPNVQALTSIGKSKEIMYLNIVTTLLNIVLNYLLIPHFGITGAALATGLSYAILNTSYSLYLYKLEKIHPLYPTLVKPAIYSIATGLTVYTLLKHFWMLDIYAMVVFSILFLVFHVFSIFHFGGIEEEDIMLINSIERRVGINLNIIKKIIRKLM